MNKMQSQVRLFQQIMSQPNPDRPIRLTDARKNFRNALFMEEFTEYLRADNIVDEADALGDMLYILFGTCVEHGLNMQPIFDIIQEANMNKIWDDGVPHFNELGKVIKPPNWVKPEPLIELEVMKQMEGK